MKNITLTNQKNIKTNAQKEHLFNQYTFYLNGAEKTSDRRQSANNFMWTIHAVFISGFGLTFTSTENFKFLQILIGLQAIFFCIYWRQLILSYKKLNGTKFKIIIDIEKELPLNIYGYEWQEIKNKINEKYKTFSEIEIKIPVIFLTFWILAIISLLWIDAYNFISILLICSLI